MSTVDHKTEAESLLERSANSTGDPTTWLLAAQASATLALVEQQRIANLIALGRLDGVAGLDPLASVSEPVAVDDQADSPWGITASRVLRADIRAGLGMS